MATTNFSFTFKAKSIDPALGLSIPLKKVGGYLVKALRWEVRDNKDKSTGAHIMWITQVSKGPEAGVEQIINLPIPDNRAPENTQMFTAALWCNFLLACGLEIAKDAEVTINEQTLNACLGVEVPIMAKAGKAQEGKDPQINLNFLHPSQFAAANAYPDVVKYSPPQPRAFAGAAAPAQAAPSMPAAAFSGPMPGAMATTAPTNGGGAFAAGITGAQMPGAR